MKNNDSSSSKTSAYLQKLNIRANKLISKKNSFFCFSLVLVGILSLIFAWLIESNAFGVASIDGLDFRYCLLLILIVGLMALMAVFVDYFILYRYSKQRKFGLICGGLLLNNCYELCSLSREKEVYYQYLNCEGIDCCVSKRLVATKVVSEKISKFIYSSIVLLIGAIFAWKTTNIILYILSVVVVVCVGIWLFTVLFFYKFKEKYIRFIAGLSKFLFKCKIIQDYAGFYNNLVSKIVYYGSELKKNRINVVSQSCAGVVTKFMKHLLLYVIFCMLGLSDSGAMLTIIFNLTILDLILESLPLPNGIIVYEILFLHLFRGLFFPGFVLYGMVIYRLFSSMIIYLIYAMGYLVFYRKKMVKLRQYINN